MAGEGGEGAGGEQIKASIYELLGVMGHSKGKTWLINEGMGCTGQRTLRQVTGQRYVYPAHRSPERGERGNNASTTESLYYLRLGNTHLICIIVFEYMKY